MSNLILQERSRFGSSVITVKSEAKVRKNKCCSFLAHICLHHMHMIPGTMYIAIHLLNLGCFKEVRHIPGTPSHWDSVHFLHWFGVIKTPAISQGDDWLSLCQSSYKWFDLTLLEKRPPCKVTHYQGLFLTWQAFFKAYTPFRQCQSRLLYKQLLPVFSGTKTQLSLKPYISYKVCAGVGSP